MDEQVTSEENTEKETVQEELTEETTTEEDYDSDLNRGDAFGETDNMDLSRKDAVEDIDFNNVFTMKKGEEFVLIKANTFLRLYYVELADGRRGILTDYVAA